MKKNDKYFSLIISFIFYSFLYFVSHNKKSPQKIFLQFIISSAGLFLYSETSDDAQSSKSGV